MSDSDGEPIVSYASKRKRTSLFHQNSSSSDHDDASPPPSPPKPTKKSRAAPRFLGDDDDSTSTTKGPSALWDDLDDLPNDLGPATRRGILDVDAFNGLGGAGDGDGDGDEEIDVDAVNVDKVGNGNEFGVDEDGNAVDEVKKKKKRVVAKMDDNRLLGENGFPNLIKQVGMFKPSTTKGNEVKDLKRLMSIYQLWAHQMYPKTNLRDTLVAVEKLCHKRSVHRALTEYRHDFKNGAKEARRDKLLGVDAPLDLDDAESPEVAIVPSSKSTSVPSNKPPPPPAKASSSSLAPPTSTATFVKASQSQNVNDLFNDFDEDEEAMLAELELESLTTTTSSSSAMALKKQKAPLFRTSEEDEEENYEDEEAILAELEREEQARQSGGQKELGVKKVVKKAVAVLREVEEEEFDEEAMMLALEMESEVTTTIPVPAKNSQPQEKKKNAQQEEEDDDEFGGGWDEEAEAAMMEMEKSATTTVVAKTPVTVEKKKVVVEEEIDFDTLMDDEPELTAEEAALLDGNSGTVGEKSGEIVDEGLEELLAAEEEMLAELS